MTIHWEQELRPGAALHTLVQEATAALIAMDAERLEELALCCADLNRAIEAGNAFAEVAEAAGEIAAETELLGRILIETRANLAVLSRLRVIHLREHFDRTRVQEEAVRVRIRNSFFSSGESYGDN